MRGLHSSVFDLLLVAAVEKDGFDAVADACFFKDAAQMGLDSLRV